jgi:hypothetical protein
MSIAVAFLQGLAGGFLVVLFLVLVVGGLLLAAVLGRASQREEPGRPGRRPGSSLLPARILCATGLGFAVVGAFSISVAIDVLGMILGAVGYYLGARVFGVIIVILSTVALFIGLLTGEGTIPITTR